MIFDQHQLIDGTIGISTEKAKWVNLSALVVGFSITPSMDSTVTSMQPAAASVRKSAREKQRTRMRGCTGKRASPVLFVLAVNLPIAPCMASTTTSTEPSVDMAIKRSVKPKGITRACT